MITLDGRNLDHCCTRCHASLKTVISRSGIMLADIVGYIGSCSYCAALQVWDGTKFVEPTKEQIKQQSRVNPLMRINHEKYSKEICPND